VLQVTAAAFAVIGAVGGDSACVTGADSGGMSLDVGLPVFGNTDIHRLSGQGPLYQHCPAILEPAEAITAIYQLINSDGLDIHLSKTAQ